MNFVTIREYDIEDDCILIYNKKIDIYDKNNIIVEIRVTDDSYSELFFKIHTIFKLL